MQTQLDLFGSAHGGEIILVLVLVLILIAAKQLPTLFGGLKQGVEEFIKATQEVGEELHASKERGPSSSNFISSFILWIAQGLGSGRIPWAPGTFGSVVGLVWFVFLLAGGSFWLYLIGCVVGIIVSVRFCGLAELILREEDPSSVVLDEIIALPICFATWVGILYFKEGLMPAPEYFFSSKTLPITAAIFALFRLFDIAKPSPIHQSQSLPAGWGVTIDDVLAAIYVNLVVVGVHLTNVLLTHKA
jgi:phosphatidylglycerophosphatase A